MPPRFFSLRRHEVAKKSETRRGFARMNTVCCPAFANDFQVRSVMIRDDSGKAAVLLRVFVSSCLRDFVVNCFLLRARLPAKIAGSRRHCLRLLASLLLLAGTACAQADPALLRYIESIPAIDNHAHVVAPDVAHDTGYDALRCDQLPPPTTMPPANLRFGAQTRITWKALYGVEPATAEEADARLPQVQGAARKAHAGDYFEWVLDRKSTRLNSSHIPLS